MAEKEKETKEHKILADISKPTLFVDNLTITSRKDGMYLIRLLSALPEDLKEEARFFVPKANLKKMVDVICQHLNHYPSPPESDEGKKQKKPS